MVLKMERNFSIHIFKLHRDLTEDEAIIVEAWAMMYSGDYDIEVSNQIQSSGFGGNYNCPD